MFVDLSGRVIFIELSLYWNVAYIANRGQFSLFFYTTIIFGEILELYYLYTLKKTWLEIVCYQKQYRYSFRTVGESLNEHTIPSLNLTGFTKNLINFPFCFTYTIYFFWACTLVLKQYLPYNMRDIFSSKYPSARCFLFANC